MKLAIATVFVLFVSANAVDYLDDGQVHNHKLASVHRLEARRAVDNETNNTDTKSEDKKNLRPVRTTAEKEVPQEKPVASESPAANDAPAQEEVKADKKNSVNEQEEKQDKPRVARTNFDDENVGNGLKKAKKSRKSSKKPRSTDEKQDNASPAQVPAVDEKTADNKSAVKEEPKKETPRVERDATDKENKTQAVDEDHNSDHNAKSDAV